MAGWIWALIIITIVVVAALALMVVRPRTTAREPADRFDRVPEDVPERGEPSLDTHSEARAA
jgi:hypothetical protein